MNYDKKPVIDGETVINQELLDYIQDGICRSVEKINNLEEQLADIKGTVPLESSVRAIGVIVDPIKATATCTATIEGNMTATSNAVGTLEE